jgi:hypothetical protein
MRNLLVGRRDEARYPYRACLSVFAVLAIVSLASCKCLKHGGEPTTFPADDAQRQADLAALPHGSGSLEDQLAAEAAARTKDTLTLEGVLQAVANDGVAFGAARQVSGQKMLAVYCATADSFQGLIVTVCEYPSADQAKRGETEANLVANQTAGHQSRVRGKSVLHLVARSDAQQEHIAKVLAAFDSL